MRNSLARFALVGFAVVAAPLAQAHPGHDDGHELTWDFGHLAAHPGATLMCLGLVALAAWVVYRETRSDGLLRRIAVKRDDSRRE